MASKAVLLLSLACLGQPGTTPDPSRPELRCGSYCLYTALKALDFPVESYSRFEETLGQPTQLGYSMEQLAEAARSVGAYTLAVETSLELLEARPGRFACLALLDQQGHFVNLYNIDAQSVYLIDPPTDRVMDREVFGRKWSGQALLVSTQPLTPMSAGWLSSRAIVVGAVALLAVVIALFAFVRTRSR